jgi:hypothetical protein
MRGRLAAAVALLCLSSTAQPETTAVGDTLARARIIAATLAPDTPAEAYARAARDFGEVVDQARRVQGQQQAVLALRELALDLKGRTLERLRGAEAATGGGEAALELLYRSRDWEDFGFALSAFPFWSAWLDFTLGEKQAESPRRTSLLNQAKRGFRAASMQIFQPSLVFGGWLGLAMVARTEGDAEQARKILSALDEALAGVPDHPLRGVVEQELALVGAVAPPGTAPGARHADPRRRAVALLETASPPPGAAAQAAALFRRIVGEGGMDAQLWSDLLRFRTPLAGQDLAGYEALLDAELAYEQSRWPAAAEAYRRFLANAAPVAGVDLRPLRYRQVVASLEAGRAADAVRGAEQLLADKGTEPGVRQALLKIVYVARARSTTAGASSREQAALVAAAQRFVDSAPRDADADGARLLIAQATPDTRRALALLDRIGSDGPAAGQIGTARFHLLARELARRNAEPAAALAQIGRQGLLAWDALAADERKTTANVVQQIEFRAVAAADPRAELASIDSAATRYGARFQPALLRARLRCHERLQDPDLAATDLARLAAPAPPAWWLATLLPWLQAHASPALRAEISARLASLLATQPAVQRRLAALRIDALLALGSHEEAYKEARAFVTQHPSSGEAYRALALAATADDRPYEADDAWAVLTERTPPVSPAWWEGIIARIDLRLASTRPEAACALIAAVDERGQTPPSSQHQRWRALILAAPCTERSAD